MSLQIQPTFFYESSSLEVFFQNHVWKLGVQLIHECLRYFLGKDTLLSQCLSLPSHFWGADWYSFAAWLYTETRAKHWPCGTLGWYADLTLASPPREHTGKCRNLFPPTGFIVRATSYSMKVLQWPIPSKFIPSVHLFSALGERVCQKPCYRVWNKKLPKLPFGDKVEKRVHKCKLLVAR